MNEKEGQNDKKNNIKRTELKKHLFSVRELKLKDEIQLLKNFRSSTFAIFGRDSASL